MITVDAAAALILALPDVTEGEYHHRRTWNVGDRTFVWERPFSKADIKRFGNDPVPDGPILAVKLADLADTEAVLHTAARGVFTIEHFANYAAVLVHLRVVSTATLRELLIDGWLAQAPPALAGRYTVAALRRAIRT